MRPLTNTFAAQRGFRDRTAASGSLFFNYVHHGLVVFAILISAVVGAVKNPGQLRDRVLIGGWVTPAGFWPNYGVQLGTVFCEMNLCFWKNVSVHCPSPSKDRVCCVLVRGWQEGTGFRYGADLGLPFRPDISRLMADFSSERILVRFRRQLSNLEVGNFCLSGCFSRPQAVV